MTIQEAAENYRAAVHSVEFANARVDRIMADLKQAEGERGELREEAYRLKDRLLSVAIEDEG